MIMAKQPLSKIIKKLANDISVVTLGLPIIDDKNVENIPLWVAVGIFFASILLIALIILTAIVVVISAL